MEAVLEFFRSLYNPDKLINLIQSGGYVVLAGIVFAETGLFFGFFLPGDSLLFLAGLLAAQKIFDVGYLILLLSVMAILGDTLGYSIGHRAGSALYKREDNFWFRKKHGIRISATGFGMMLSGRISNLSIDSAVNLDIHIIALARLRSTLVRRDWGNAVR